MTCDERRVVAYLAGELDDEDRADLDSHLLTCEACWSAVREDRRGRELTELLRSLAPAGLRDRIRASVELQAGVRPKPRPRRAAVALAAAALLTVIAGVSALVSLRTSADPPVVAEVLRLAVAHPEPMPSFASHDLGDRPVALSVQRMDATPVVMARAAVPFPMATHAMPLDDGSGAPWMAHRGDMTLLSLTRPEHVLLVARVPPAELLAFAREHGFAP